MTATHDVGQRSLADAQELSGFRAKFTTVAVSFDEAELAPRIVEVLENWIRVWHDKYTAQRPASDTTAAFTLIPTGKRVKIDMGKSS
ncbi:hypothetical protein N7444_003561 [Penicillium canescens]|nr:hypothetical protein N7444_003561 [Penicillium canescens]